MQNPAGYGFVKDPWRTSPTKVSVQLVGEFRIAPSPGFSLNPGEGAILNSPTNWTLTFVGEVLQGSLTDPYPAGFCIRASQVPQEATLTTLGLSIFQLTDLDSFYKFNTGTQSYDFYVYFLGSWFGPQGGGPSAEPVLLVGESMWFQ